MPLTATSILNAKPSSKARKLFDERGLYLLVNPRGSKLWRFKYRFNGKEKLLALGAFPEISLKQARDRQEKARQQLANGIDPSQERKSENTINASLRRIGFTKEEMTAHGFRAMARTILDEELGFRPEIIEHQLAHAVKDPIGRAYNRTAHLPQRKEMMQSWADYLDAIKNKTS